MNNVIGPLFVPLELELELTHRPRSHHVDAHSGKAASVVAPDGNLEQGAQHKTRTIVPISTGLVPLERPGYYKEDAIFCLLGRQQGQLSYLLRDKTGLCCIVCPCG